MTGVRYHDATALPAGSDSNVCVWDGDANRLWDAWQFNKVSPLTYTVSQAGISNTPNTWDGRYRNQHPVYMQGRGAGATGITGAATQIRMHEFFGTNGYYGCGCAIIPHVISWAVPEYYGGIKNPDDTWAERKYSFPATRTDGRNSTAPDGRLWGGQYVRLPASVDVHAVSSRVLPRTLLHAVQNYGLIVTDTAGAVSIGGDNPANYTQAEREKFQNEVLGAGRHIWQEMSGFPLHLLEVLPVDYQVTT